MKYHEALAMEHRKHICPFCKLHPAEIVDETKHMIITPARAPYHKHHILIIPKRHVIMLNDLKKSELQELYFLIHKWNSSLHTIHKDIVLYLKDGYVGGPAGKTVNHFHFHLVPNCAFGTSELTIDREFMNKKDYIKEASLLKKKFL